MKSLIFDFGSVIYKTQWDKLNDFFMNKHGISLLISQTSDQELIRIYRDSDVGKEDFIKFFSRLTLNKPLLQMLKDYQKGYATFKTVNTDLLNLISVLRKKGFLLFGFTDTKKEHYQANLQSGIYDGFQRIFTSFEFGFLKAQTQAFEKLVSALQKYNLSPSDCLFIDDYLPNIENAKSFGFITIHYLDFPSLTSLLPQLEKILGISLQ